MKIGAIFKNKWFQVIAGVLLLAFGSTAIALSVTQQTSALAESISIVLAVCLFISGVVCLIYGFVNDLKHLFSASLVAGSLLISIGVILCTNHNILNEVIIYCVGTLLIVDSVVFLGKSLLFLKTKNKLIMIILGFFFAALCLILGIMTFVYHAQGNQNVEKAIYLCMGILFVTLGLFYIITGIIVLAKEAKEKDNNAVKNEVTSVNESNNVVDAEVVSEEIKEIESKEENKDDTKKDDEQENKKPKRTRKKNNK